MQQQKKLTGKPNVVLHYTPEQAIAIPVFLIRNEVEEHLFSEVFSRYKSLGRRLIHRRLFIEQPYASFNQWGQGIFAANTIQAIVNVSWNESLRFMAVTSLEIGSLSKFFYNGIELKCLPEQYRGYRDSRQSDENIGAFCSHYSIDFKEFLYPSGRLYGQYNSGEDGTMQYAR